MTGAFLYLTVCGLTNRLRVRFRRLREPRYLVGLAAGLLYFYFVLFGRPHPTTPRGGGMPIGSAALASYALPLIAVASVVLFVVVALSWVWPSSTKAVTFTRAEVQMLFPAPLTRRQLLHYKLIRSQVGSLFGSAILTLFFRPGSIGAAWTVLVGMWVLFGILNLHFTGVALARESLTEHGASGFRRQWLPIAVIVAAIVAIGVALVRNGADLAAQQTGEQVLLHLGELLTTGPAGWALWPTRAVVSLPLAPSPLAFWRALPGVLLIFALNYAWVMRSDAAFEEASAEQSERVVRGRVAPPKARVNALSSPFSLAATGRVETAILWKNLILLGRYASARTLWRLLPLVVALAAAASGSHKSGIVAFVSILALAGTGFVIFLGPQIARNDLRQDLAHIALLKTWPIPSGALIRGELLAPLTVLSATAWLFILGSMLLITKVPSTAATFGVLVLDRVSYGLGAALLAPPLIVVQLIVQNGLAVLFPAWAVIGATRSRGVDVMGQRLLMQAGIWLSLILALLPAAAAAAVVVAAVYLTIHVIPIVAPAAVGAVVILGEAFLATEALGKALDRTDVGSLEPQDS